LKWGTPRPLNGPQAALRQAEQGDEQKASTVGLPADRGCDLWKWQQHCVS